MLYDSLGINQKSGFVFLDIGVQLLQCSQKDEMNKCIQSKHNCIISMESIRCSVTRLWKYYYYSTFSLSEILPPDLSQLKDVNDAVEEPGAASAAAVPQAAVRGAEAPLSPGRRHHGRRGGGTGAARLRVIVSEPAEAQHLHHDGRNHHEGEGQREPEVIPPQVIVGGQPQVGRSV